MTTSSDDLFEYHMEYLSPGAQEFLLKFVERVKFRKVPFWLGNFKFTYDAYPFHDDLAAIVEHLSSLVPEQKFNTVFLQKYETGTKVKPHRDPHTNKGMTVIATFGQWTGAMTDICGIKIGLRPGDVLVQRCTVDDERGPKHSVSEVLSGTRYAIILNTIQK